MCYLLNNFGNSLYYNLNENYLNSLFEISCNYYNNFIQTLNTMEYSNKFYNDQDRAIKHLNFCLADSNDLTDEEYHELYKKIKGEFRKITLSLYKSKDYAPENRLGVLSDDINVILKAYHPDIRHQIDI